MLKFRNCRTHQKAQEYLRRGMTLAASYYNEVAHLHKQKYEQANSMAAAVLIQVSIILTSPKLPLYHRPFEGFLRFYYICILRFLYEYIRLYRFMPKIVRIKIL